MKLFKRFEIVVLWQVILLLDEVDVYLLFRKYLFLSLDVILINVMIGVFLWVLEYYKGFFFLINNMVDYFEEVIFLRMFLFVEF